MLQGRKTFESNEGKVKGSAKAKSFYKKNTKKSLEIIVATLQQQIEKRHNISTLSHFSILFTTKRSYTESLLKIGQGWSRGINARTKSNFICPALLKHRVNFKLKIQIPFFFLVDFP